MNLLQKIEDYFKKWDGIEKTAPKMELCIQELRYITQMNQEKCEAERYVKSLKSRYMDGVNVQYKGSDESDGILCPMCGYEVARNDDFEDMRPKHCPECGTKLIYSG